METKDLIGLILIPVALAAGTVTLCLSERLRDIAFFIMASAAVISDRLDINFLSRQWYRGTTRGIEFSFIDVLAFSIFASLLIAPRLRDKRFFWPASLGFMLVFLGYECFSIGISEPKLFGLFELSKTIRAIFIFLAAALYVKSERELRFLVLAVGCAVCLEGALAVKHKLILHVDRATGTLDHANSLSMYLCMTAPLFTAAVNSSFPRYIRVFSTMCIGFAAIGIVMTISRAGIPIFGLVMLGATVICMTWKITLKKIAGTIGIVVGVSALLALSWNSLAERFGESDIAEEMDTKQFENRGQYFGLAKEILKDKPLGVGLNNWSYHVSKTYGERVGSPYEDYDDIPPSVLYSDLIFDWAAKYAPPAHNLGVITIGELGVPGFIIFVLLWLRWFSMGFRFLWRRTTDPMYRVGTGIFFCICGIFLQSLTEWVYRQTAILLTFHVLLGTLAALIYYRKHHRAEVEQQDPVDDDDVVDCEIVSEPAPAERTL
jgi:hypothetical protein